MDDEEENGFLKAFKVSLPLSFFPLLLVLSGSVFTDLNAPLVSMVNCVPIHNLVKLLLA